MNSFFQGTSRFLETFPWFQKITVQSSPVLHEVNLAFLELSSDILEKIDYGAGLALSAQIWTLLLW